MVLGKQRTLFGISVTFNANEALPQTRNCFMQLLRYDLFHILWTKKGISTFANPVKSLQVDMKCFWNCCTSEYKLNLIQRHERLQVSYLLAKIPFEKSVGLVDNYRMHVPQANQFLWTVNKRIAGWAYSTSRTIQSCPVSRPPRQPSRHNDFYMMVSERARRWVTIIEN